VSAVFISYPKSGRTWFRYLLGLAKLDVTFAHGRKGQVPLLTTAAGRTGIFLHRNPIDTAVSHFFFLNRYKLRWGTWRHLKALAQGRLPPRDLVAFLDHPAFGVAGICRYNRLWLDHLRGRPEFLVVTYEDMVTKPQETLAGVLHHLEPGQNFDVAWLIQEADFTRMREVEDAGGWRHLGGQKRRSDPDSRFIRRGKVGGYRDYLSEPEQRRFEAIVKSITP
jgi:hypothetical protein